jgi:dihydrolipoamide dehydrogenase
MHSDVKTYDVVVIGSGSGQMIVNAALRQGLKVALVEKGALGGTCANVGCIPSKMLITPADRVMEIREAQKLGIRAEIQAIDFRAIMERMRRLRDEELDEMRESIGRTENLDFYPIEGHFVDDHTLEVGGTRIRGEKVFIVAGTRPLIPPVPGLDQVDYLTSDTVFDLEEQPDDMIIVGGGYIACEFGHFFSAMGTEVTIVGRNERLAPGEEPEISELLQQKLSERMRVFTSTEVSDVRRDDGGYTVIGRNRRTGEETQFAGQYLLVATGRRSNADLLRVGNASIETDQRGYIQVNEYMETNVPNIWAFGDVIGKQLFKHHANREAMLAWHNSQHDNKAVMDYRVSPHAVFTYPQIASVGLTEEQAKRERKILVGRAGYTDVAYGVTLMEEDGFAKAIVDAESDEILGFHIIGPHAAILVQEVVNAMASAGNIASVAIGMHVHPALPELVLRTLNNLHAPE